MSHSDSVIDMYCRLVKLTYLEEHSMLGLKPRPYRQLLHFKIYVPVTQMLL